MPRILPARGIEFAGNRRARSDWCRLDKGDTRYVTTLSASWIMNGLPIAKDNGEPEQCGNHRRAAGLTLRGGGSFYVMELPERVPLLLVIPVA